MKIVDTDNFGGDYPNEQLIADNITNKEMGEVMAEALNAKYCAPTNPFAYRYYKLVEDAYKLQPGFEP
jgi:hypothetical protein